MLLVAISTVYSRLELINKDQFPKDSNIYYLVSCQGQKIKSDIFYEKIIRGVFGDNVVVSFMEGYGLSLNRNNAIGLAIDRGLGDYIYICDDDVTISKAGLSEIFCVARQKKLDFVSGMINSDKALFKSYPRLPMRINRLNAARVSSVEMILSIEFIKRNSIDFNKNFGLGAVFPSGEEYILICDFMRKKAKAYYYPIIIAYHPPVSSGADFFTEDIKISAKGAMFATCFSKPIAIIFIILFTIKKYKHYKKCCTFGHFIQVMLKGFKLGLNYK